MVDLRFRAWQPPEGGPLRLLVFDPASAWGRAGLHTGDRLLSIDGRPMTTWPEVRAVLGAARIGDTLHVEVTRPTGPFRANVIVSGYDRPVVQLEELPNATERQRAVRAAWLAAGAPDAR